MNVITVGHNKEQPTKLNNFRPELGAFVGYTFKRNSDSVIEVWIPAECTNCRCNARYEGHFVRVGNASDELIRRHGLRLFEGESPIRGVRVHTAAPFLCEHCSQKWLKGEVLENLIDSFN